MYYSRLTVHVRVYHIQEFQRCQSLHVSISYTFCSRNPYGYGFLFVPVCLPTPLVIVPDLGGLSGRLSAHEISISDSICVILDGMENTPAANYTPSYQI